MLKSKLLARLSNIDHGFLMPSENPPDHMLRVDQVHGKDLVFISRTPSHDNALEKADGLITNQNIAIGVQTADCMPVLFYAKTKDSCFVAAVHAGWRGLYDGILIETVEKLQQHDVNLNSIHVAVGPHIHSCCFEVSTEIVDQFCLRYPFLDQKTFYFNEQPQGKNIPRQPNKTESNCWLSMFDIARSQLINQGFIRTENIENLNACTYCAEERFASYRRSTHKKQQDHSPKKSARQWSYIFKTS